MLLLDTNIASYFFPMRNAPPERALYAADLSGEVLAVSFQTVGELWLWAEENQWGTGRRAALQAYIDGFVVVPYRTTLARIWAEMTAFSRSAGRRLEAADAWIAATAVDGSLTLVTHDKDLAATGWPGLKVVCRAP